MEPATQHHETCSEGSPRVTASSAEPAANSPGEAGATGRGEKGGGCHLGSLELADGGAEHHRSAWETSGDATRLCLRGVCD